MRNIRSTELQPGHKARLNVPHPTAKRGFQSRVVTVTGVDLPSPVHGGWSIDESGKVGPGYDPGSRVRISYGKGRHVWTQAGHTVQIHNEDEVPPLFNDRRGKPA